MAKDLSRREFLKGMAAGAVSLGTMAVLPALGDPVTAHAEAGEEKETVVSSGSPEKLRKQLEDADFRVQSGKLYEFDTLRLASEGKLLTCFGNNAGSTYLILNLPPAPNQNAAPGNPERGWEGELESAFDDPDVENAPENPFFSPAGMAFKMRQDEAVVIVTRLPDVCKYWSFIAYNMFDKQLEGKDYTNEKAYFGFGNDESGYYHSVFASIGWPVNMMNARHDGDSSFGTQAVIVLCANKKVRDSISACLTAAGYPDGMVNVMEIPADIYRMGLERGKDTFSIFGRVSQPEDRDAFKEYLAALPETATVLRVSPKEEIPADTFAVQTLKPRGSGVHEAARLQACSEKLDRIRETLIAKYADEYDYEELSTDIGITDGLTAYMKDADAQGDVLDAAYLNCGDFTLQSDEDFVVVYGVNHNYTGKARYFNAVLHERPLINGVCSVYNSMLPGTADAYLGDLAGEDADGYYVYKMARTQMDEHTAIIPYATGNEQGRFYGVDNGSKVFVLFRLYVDETGIGASYYELINDRVIVFHKK
ncbi:MAG: twin-arginine translocation signal domain-containing protein [Candidatus Limivicinus sp.]